MTEKSRGTATDEGERVNRTMRIHVQAKVRDQEEQFEGQGELEKAGEVPKSEDANVKVPRIEIDLSGSVLHAS